MGTGIASLMLAGFVEPVVGVTIALTASMVHVARQRSERARAHRHVLASACRLLKAKPREIASMLGTSRQAVQQALIEGVPASWQPSVIRLYRVAAELRRSLPPAAARRLLLLRRSRTRRVLNAPRIVVSTPPSQAKKAARVIITVR